MVEIIDYVPKERHNPNVIVDPLTAWGDIHTIIKDIINRFSIKPNKAIEFGVWYGFSTSALANYFNEVIGVDTFQGDIHAGYGNIIEFAQRNLAPYPNIKLVEASYQDYILNRVERCDLIHIDIVHTYEDTYVCGDWAVNNSDVVIFHDTESFADVRRACSDLAEKYGLKFYNYTPSYGLGILVRE